MAIILSERAAKHICQQITRRGKGLALRVGMKKLAVRVLLILSTMLMRYKLVINCLNHMMLT